MRLTLRTLLAYIDGILPPEDTEDIGRRIEESEQATELLHRVRDVMRRLRLAAPGLSDGGMGLDPNTVAEYLDNTLPPNRVADFEKLCLDSDVHLAELAACHQILAMVLGEAAEIDPATRDRMYALADQETAGPGTSSSDAEAAGGAAAGAGAPADQPPVHKRRKKPVVPDYLREPRNRSRLVPVAVAVGLTLCIALIVLGATGQFQQGSALDRTIAQVFGSDGEEVEVSEGPDDQRPIPDVRGEDENAEPEELDEGPDPEEVVAPLPEPGGGDDLVPDGGVDVPGGQTDEIPADPDSGAGPDANPDGGPDVGPIEVPVDLPPGEGLVPAEPVDVVVPEPPVGLAGLMSERQIVLRFNPDENVWQRVRQQGVVTAGQRLLSLPTYRPLLALMSAEVTAQLVDGTQAELLPNDAAGVPGVKVDFGRLVVRTVGRAGTQVRLQCGSHTGLITFSDARSAAAVEVTPVHLPGTDPEADPGSRWVVTDVYATGGDILWTEGDGEPVQIASDNWMLLSGDVREMPIPVKELPEWLAPDTATSLENGADRLASANLERELQGDRAERLGASLVLMELNEHQRRENRWLAARCLGYVGDFAPLADPLADPDFPPVWTSQAIEFLRAGVERSPEAASQVCEALEKEHGPDAPVLLRMFWGYSDDQLKGGEALRLIEGLESESLAVRTLSFACLRDLFGLTLSYQATDRETVRRARAQRWRDSLESGELWTKRDSAISEDPRVAPPPPPTQ